MFWSESGQKSASDQTLFTKMDFWSTGRSVKMDCGLGYIWFLSAVWTLILTAPIHCRASIAETLMQRHFSKSISDELSVNTFSANVRFYLNSCCNAPSTEWIRTAAPLDESRSTEPSLWPDQNHRSSPSALHAGTHLSFR